MYGTLITKFTLNNKWHNPNGPVIIEIEDTGSWTQCYYINGLMHRLDGPALIKYFISNDEICQFRLEYGCAVP